MVFVNYTINASKEEVLGALSDSNTVVEAERFDTSRGVPKVHIKQKDDTVRMFCEMTGRPTRDRDFRYSGTRFFGRITEKNGVTAVRGVIWTAPLYHLVLAGLFVYFIFRCISLGAISVVPICLLIFDLFMFSDEFRKQRVIKRYIFRALKITYKRLQTGA